MDIWVQRLMALIVLVSVVGFVYSYSMGRDGQVFSYLTGLVTGLLGTLGVANIFAKTQVSS